MREVTVKATETNQTRKCVRAWNVANSTAKIVEEYLMALGK